MSPSILCAVTALGFGMPGPMEWVIIMIVALLLFGKRLPEIMRSMGRGVVEFKKGIRGIEDDVEQESTKPEVKRSIPPPSGEAKPT
ncbi:MAG: twin-arginine translocase TatA/TatE family subunit [Planctomycetota bacterium]